MAYCCFLRLDNENGVTDIDGNYYPAVRIGNQVWTTVNLRVTRFNDGTPIPHVSGNAMWEGMKTPAYCFYKNETDPSEQKKWGALYNWYAIGTGKLAPKGWRVPTADDWTRLEKYLIENGFNWDGSLNSNKIAKVLASEIGWETISNKAGAVGNVSRLNNFTGFSALPGGLRFINGFFAYKAYSTYWWSATECDASGAYYRTLSWHTSDLRELCNYKRHGYSVRLVRD